jgi:hypothetical protein
MSMLLSRHTRRRDFITLVGGAAVAWPFAARAQQSERVRRIGVLIAVAENDAEAQGLVAALQRGLQEAGWIEDRNIHLEYRWGAYDADRAQTYAAELVWDQLKSSGIGFRVIQSISRDRSAFDVAGLRSQFAKVRANFSCPVASFLAFCCTEPRSRAIASSCCWSGEGTAGATAAAMGVRSNLCNGCGLRCTRRRRLNGRCARLCGDDFGTGWRVRRGQQGAELGEQGYWPAKLRCPARDYLLGGIAVGFPSQDARVPYFGTILSDPTHLGNGEWEDGRVCEAARAAATSVEGSAQIPGNTARPWAARQRTDGGDPEGHEARLPGSRLGRVEISR